LIIHLYKTLTSVLSCWLGGRCGNKKIAEGVACRSKNLLVDIYKTLTSVRNARAEEGVQMSRGGLGMGQGEVA